MKNRNIIYYDYFIILNLFPFFVMLLIYFIILNPIFFKCQFVTNFFYEF